MVRPFDGSSGTDFAIYKLLAVIGSYQQLSAVFGSYWSFQQLSTGIGSYMQLPTVTVS
jgi:hypothetical protein